MQTVRVVARESFPYAGIVRSVGESFDATDDDARILTLIGKVGLVQPLVSVPIHDELGDDHDGVAPRRRRVRRQSISDIPDE